MWKHSRRRIPTYTVSNLLWTFVEAKKKNVLRQIMRQERRNVYNGYTEKKKECKSYMFDGKLIPCAHLYDNPQKYGNTLPSLFGKHLDNPALYNFTLLLRWWRASDREIYDDDAIGCQSHAILRDHSSVRGLWWGWCVSAGQGSSAQCLCTRAQVIVNTTCTGNCQHHVHFPTPHTYPSKITNDLALTENSKIWKII